MKIIAGILFAAAALSSCKSSNVMNMNEAESPGASREKDDFKPLFDGKTTVGWHGYGKQGGVSGWKVENGALTPDTAIKNSHVDLVTNEEYDNFHLKLEWKISPKGNSGIIFFINEDPAKYRQTYETGLEMQVLDNDGHSDGKIIKHRAGDLYDLVTVSKETVKPVGEWNKAEIVSKNGKLDLYLNGQHSVSTTLWDDNWKTMVANSKFKTMPGFGTFKKGRIGLQYHGDVVWYRNIEIQKL